MLIDTETHPFIDLQELGLPFDDLLTEEDLDIIKGNYQLSEVKHTHNFAWYPNQFNQSAPNGATIHRNTTCKKLYEFVKDIFKVDIVGDVKKTIGGKAMFPISILKFHGNTQWHREGYPYWADDNYKNNFTRTNFAFNFPLYCETADTKVRFAKGSKELEINVMQNSNTLMKQDKWETDTKLDIDSISKNYYKNMGKQVYHNGIKTTFQMDLLDDELESNLTVIGEKVSYDCPYIIPLSSWHQVITNGVDNRCSLRFFGNNDYTFSDICKLYDEGDLING